MSSALVTLITLIIGLFLGLGLGIWISRIKNSASSSDSLAQELNDVKVLLKASDERLKAAEEKSQADIKIATQMEEMKTTVERMRAQSQEAAEKRIASETQLVILVRQSVERVTSVSRAAQAKMSARYGIRQIRKAFFRKVSFGRMHNTPRGIHW